MSRWLLPACFVGSVAFGALEPPLPVWEPDERARLIEEGWLAGSLLLTYGKEPEAKEEEPPEELALEAPSAEDLAGADEDESVVSEEFLTEYFAEKPEGFLVDPQDLLGLNEKKDLSAFLDYHAGDSSIDLYIYVFGADQEIPGEVREEEVVERLYSVGTPAVVVYYYLGAPQRSAMYLSPIITDVVSAAEQRRALQSSVMQAFASVVPGEQLEAFLVQMAIRIYWMERMSAGTAVETLEEIPLEASQREFHKKEVEVTMEERFPSWARIAAGVAAAAFGGLLALWSAGMWWRARARYVFPEFEVEPRMGGNHAAGIGAVISFSSTAVPPARQRDQVPDYMRRA